MSDYVNQMRGMSKDGKKLENQIERKSKRTVEQSPERIKTKKSKEFDNHRLDRLKSIATIRSKSRGSLKNFENFDEKSRSDINDKSILRKSLTEKHDDDGISYRGESPDYKSSEKKTHGSSLSKKSDNNDSASGYKSNEIREMIRLLKSQKDIINDYKAKLRYKRKKLESVNNYSAIKVKENELSELKKQLKQIKTEREEVRRTKEKQNKKKKSGVLEEQRELKKMKEKQEMQKNEYKRLQMKNKELDSKISHFQKTILVLTRKLNSVFKKTQKMEDVMSSKNWHKYSQKDIQMLREKYGNILQSRKKLREEHAQEKNYFNEKFEHMKRSNNKLVKEIQVKEKEIRYNTLKLRKIRKGLAYGSRGLKT